MEWVSFEPIYMERVWGGRDLQDKLGRTLPEGSPVGESWEVVDRPEAQSVVNAGIYKGLSIRELIEQHSETIMGPKWDANKPFPILVKWLDCQERLSLQVHPPAAVAPKLGGEPKTEAWYIADCKENAALIAGLKANVTREAFDQALRDGELEPLCHRLLVNPGESIFIPSGRIHAIDAGNLILEIQQNSDTTYRVYDWGRVGLNGKPRQLHIEESLESIDFDDFEPPINKANGGQATIADSDVFRIQKLELKEGLSVRFRSGDQPRLLGIVDGELKNTAGETLSAGMNVLLPYSETVELEALSSCVMLVTDNFV